MRTSWLAVFTILAIPSAFAQNGPEPNSISPEKANFCEIVRHPEKYDGKMITFTALYGTGMEGAVFFDETCKRPKPNDDVITLATFSRKNYNFKSPLDKKLLKLLKKTDRVQVTVVGIFIDGKDRVFGHMNCCRYKIEVQQLLDVQPVIAK
jgi:hypothetical protein